MLERQRPRILYFHRPRHPPATSGGSVQRVLAEALVGQQTDVGLDALALQVGFDPLHRLDEQLLEVTNAAQVTAALLRQLHQLPAMVERKDEQLFPGLAGHADLVQPLQHGILVRPGDRHRALE
ncbi:hypothetical protein D3C78_1561800 [compost metagenome]